MAIRNKKLGGTDWGEESLKPLSDLNPTINAIITDTAPIGSVMAWLKDYTNTPALPILWAECNGQILEDEESPYNGQTLPDLNGENRFLRGNSTTGSTGGSESHTLTHAHNMMGSSNSSGSIMGGHLCKDYYRTYTNTTLQSGSVTFNNRPPYMDVVWIIKIR
jgi:hypothetical protein